LLSKLSKLHNLESHFSELLRPRAPPFQKIKRKFVKPDHFYAKLSIKIDVPKCFEITVVMLIVRDLFRKKEADFL
jgi:hypothetical protein